MTQLALARTPFRIPVSALEGRSVWVAWREESAEGRTKTKIPYAPHGGGKARSDDQGTWGTFAEAKARAKTLLANGQRGGIGLMLGDVPGEPHLSIGGVDLDSCREPETGRIEDWALEVIDRVSSYCEISPSERGVKIFFTYERADLPQLRAAMKSSVWSKSFPRGSHCEIAIHFGRRYFAFTRWPLGELDPDILELIGYPEMHFDQAELGALLWLIEEAGPAFASRDAAKPMGRKAPDDSRSGRAFHLAIRLKRAGADFQNFVEELNKDDDLADWAQDTRQVRRAWENSLPSVHELDGFSLTEDGVGLAFVERHRDSLRYDHTSGHWFLWDQTKWHQEKTRLAFHWAREVCRDLARRDPTSSAARTLAKAASASAVERFAQADRAFAVTGELWDSDPFLLGTPAGTVDLRKGTLREASSGDYITRQTSVGPDPDAGCPRWLQFLEEVTSGDHELVRFIHQWCGYALTGDIREHALLFIWGPGGNGKSVLLNTLSAILGTYSVSAPIETFVSSKNDRHPTELAMLRGARLVSASETEEGRAWARVRINQLTGGDPIAARFMRQDFFEFLPIFKLMIVGNNKPILHSVDDAAKRRFNIVNFEYKPKKPDRELESKLKAEWPGILSWAIRGCLDWQANGLITPKVVKDATADYFADQDIFGQFLEERCELDRSYVVAVSTLWNSWNLFATARGGKTGTRSGSFADALRGRGFEAIRNTNGIRGRGYAGIRLKNEESFFE